MHKILKLILTASLLISLQLPAEIYEIKSIKEVLNHLDSREAQIVVFDIDNTLLCPKQDLGSDQWFSYVAKQNMINGLNQIEAYDQILPTYFHIQKYINLLPTESDLAGSVKEIEQVCDHTICLTARSLQLLDITIEQLAKNNLDFHVPEINRAKLDLPQNSIYQDGVLFCGHNCKGQVLKQFLAACHYTPTQIILVDDKRYNLESVEKQLSLVGIKFIGLRYAGCDERIAGFNINQANQDLVDFLSRYPLNN